MLIQNDSFQLDFINYCPEHEMVNKDPFGQSRPTIRHLCSHKFCFKHSDNAVHPYPYPS